MAIEPKPTRRRYRTGDEALDAKIAELVEASAIGNDSDLLTEMLTSCFRVARDRADRGEMRPWPAKFSSIKRRHSSQ